MLLATGGNETTAQLLSNLVLLLERKPEILARLRAEPELRPSAVEEVLRYISPVTGLFRHTTREVVVAGTELPGRGQGAAHVRLGRTTTSASTSVPTSSSSTATHGFADADHVSFTTGIHVCLGGHLARLLINVFLERMAERIDTIEIAGPVVRSSNALVRVIDDLPVVLTPRAR